MSHELVQCKYCKWRRSGPALGRFSMQTYGWHDEVGIVCCLLGGLRSCWAMNASAFLMLRHVSTAPSHSLLSHWCTRAHFVCTGMDAHLFPLSGLTDRDNVSLHRWVTWQVLQIRQQANGAFYFFSFREPCCMQQEEASLSYSFVRFPADTGYAWADDTWVAPKMDWKNSSSERRGPAFFFFGFWEPQFLLGARSRAETQSFWGPCQVLNFERAFQVFPEAGRLDAAALGPGLGQIGVCVCVCAVGGQEGRRVIKAGGGQLNPGTPQMAGLSLLPLKDEAKRRSPFACPLHSVKDSSSVLADVVMAPGTFFIVVRVRDRLGGEAGLAKHLSQWPFRSPSALRNQPRTWSTSGPFFDHFCLWGQRQI